MVLSKITAHAKNSNRLPSVCFPIVEVCLSLSLLVYSPFWRPPFLSVPGSCPRGAGIVLPLRPLFIIFLALPIVCFGVKGWSLCVFTDFSGV